MIHINHLTKAFKNGKGIFDVTFEVKQGEVFGFLGPNGAGKTTTVRHLMGFIKPSEGFAQINNLDCWSNSEDIKRNVGYLPGEIVFPEGMNGLQFLHLLAGMRGMNDLSTMNRLIDKLQFEVKTPFRKMSKGMKQKVGIVAAFMHNPDILILDEPTSGLDPLMQSLFLDLILEAKARGKTVLMSSHSFEEINRTCDRAGIIKDGRLISVEDIKQLQSIQRKIFELTVSSKQDIEKIRKSGLEVIHEDQHRIQVVVQGSVDHFIQVISQCQVYDLNIHTQKLEDIFMLYYDRKVNQG